MAQRSMARRRSRRRDEEDEFDPTPDESGDIGRYDDDDDDEPPRSRRRGRSRRDDDDDDDDEAPRRSRRSRRDDDDDDDDDEAPRRSRRSRRDDDDDEGERERPSRKVASGWGGYKSTREKFSDYVKFYKLPEDQAELIKILDAEPFAVFSEHWIEEKQGKKSYTCLEEDCPLCDIAGDRPRVYVVFNVLDLRDPEDPKVVPWRASPTVADILEGYANDKKTSPINREDLYFSIRKTGGGKKGRVQTHLNTVKARDLVEDWDIEPFTEEELDEFTLFTKEDVVEHSSHKVLKAIADDLL